MLVHQAKHTQDIQCAFCGAFKCEITCISKFSVDACDSFYPVMAGEIQNLKHVLGCPCSHVR